MAESTKLLDHVQRFLGACPQYDFPAGGDEPIPLPCEVELLHGLQSNAPLGMAEIAPIADSMNTRGAYTLTIFSIRMAVNAARTGDPAILLNALPCLAMHRDLVDSRDILRALSIIEDCATRVEIDTSAAFESIAVLGSPVLADTLRDAWFPRTPEWRAVEVMGYKAIESPVGLQFVRRR